MVERSGGKFDLTAFGSAAVFGQNIAQQFKLLPFQFQLIFFREIGAFVGETHEHGIAR